LHYIGFGFKEHFCSLAANNGAIATSDAPFVDDFCLAPDDFDSFHRAFPYTGIANPAFVLYGINQLFTFGVAHPDCVFG